jgi:hypothetical protein
MPAGTFPTGIPSIDEATGGLPRHAITEVVCATPSCGAQLLIGQLLAAARAHLLRAALVDATDSFDAALRPDDELAHLLWVRCARVETALPAADLLARDANLGLVLLDLRRVSEVHLRRIPSRQWYVFQRAVETTDLALVVVTPRVLVPSAQLRFELSGSHGVAALEAERPGLVAKLAPVLQRQRFHSFATPTVAAVA